MKHLKNLEAIELGFLSLDSAGEHPAGPRGHPFPAPGTLHGALPRELLLRGRHVRLHSQLQGVLR